MPFRSVTAAWRLSLEAGYPNLLSAEDVERRERIVLKLLRLIPKEYQSGVRDGEITIPIEYREAKSFTIQTQQIINELMPGLAPDENAGVGEAWSRTSRDTRKSGNVQSNERRPSLKWTVLSTKARTCSSAILGWL